MLVSVERKSSNRCRELDPHGQFGDGNPIGGNVTSNVTGNDQHFAEWMVSSIHSAVDSLRDG